MLGTTSSDLRPERRNLTSPRCSIAGDYPWPRVFPYSWTRQKFSCKKWMSKSILQVAELLTLWLFDLCGNMAKKKRFSMDSYGMQNFTISLPNLTLQCILRYHRNHVLYRSSSRSTLERPNSFKPRRIA